MKRLRDWLFNFAAAVSLMLCLGITILWVRSYSHADWVHHAWPQRAMSIGLLSVHGRTCYAQNNGGPPPSPVPDPFDDLAPLDRRGSHPLIAHELEWGNVAGFNVTMFEAYWGRSAGGQTVSLLHRRHLPPMPVPPGSTPEQTLYVVIPHWMLIVIMVPLPAYWLVHRRNRSAKPGFCRECGYDLRATPNRCPECGVIPSAAKEAAT